VRRDFEGRLKSVFGKDYNEVQSRPGLENAGIQNRNGKIHLEQGEKMRKKAILPVTLLLGLAFAGQQLLSAAEKTLTLPKGTSVQKIGMDQVRFVLPNGQTVEVKGYNAKTGIIGDTGVYQKGKLLMKGGRGSLIGVVVPDPPSIIRAPKVNTFVLFRGALTSMKTLAKVPHSEYVMIDDEVTWLPATIQFKPSAGKTVAALQTAKAGTASISLPKGTTAQKLGAGHFRFTPPDGKAVEVKGYNAKTGIIGDTGVYDKGKLTARGSGGSLVAVIDPDPPYIIRAPKENTCIIVGGGLVSMKTLAKIPHSEYVMIDDEVTWLPATIRFD
jgi:hypothetical protein